MEFWLIINLNIMNVFMIMVKFCINRKLNGYVHKIIKNRYSWKKRNKKIYKNIKLPMHFKMRKKRMMMKRILDQQNQ